MSRTEILPIKCIERQSRPVILHELSVAPDTRIPAHDHERSHLCVVLEGGFEEEDRRGSRWCDRMSWRLSPAGDAHRLRVGNQGLVCLLFEPGEITLPEIRERSFFAETFVVRLAARIRHELQDEATASPLTLESLTLELFAQATRGGKRLERHPPWVELVREALHDLTLTTPTLHGLARLAGRHPMQVARGFREHFGCSVGEYRMRVQLDAARSQLIGTDDPISAIAYATGFADQSHMTRLLRQRLGETPARLRARHRGLTAARRSDDQASSSTT